MRQPTAAMPWLDGLPGCTMSEAWPTTPEVYNLFMSRPDPNQVIWGNRSPDYLRTTVGNGRSTTNTTTTMQFSVGLEGELPSGDDFWDVTVSTGRSDNVVNQLGSVRLSSLRALYLVPNYGRGAVFDPNPTHSGFAESTPTCESGLPIIDRFVPTKDCVQILSPSLKNEREMTQNILEANLTGDLVEMPSGPLQYALGLSYRDNSFNFVPDNLSDNANFLDPIAGTYPNEPSFGEFDVSELYGELLIPIVEDGPAGVDHFTRRARRPHLGLEHVEHAQSRNVQGADRLGLYSTLQDARRVQPSVPCAESGRALHRAHANLRRYRRS